MGERWTIRSGDDHHFDVVRMEQPASILDAADGTFPSKLAALDHLERALGAEQLRISYALARLRRMQRAERKKGAPHVR